VAEGFLVEVQHLMLQCLILYFNTSPMPLIQAHFGDFFVKEKEVVTPPLFVLIIQLLLVVW